MSPDEAEGFYEDDEPLEKVLAAFQAGSHGLTACPLTITYDPTVQAAYVYLVPPAEAHSARTVPLSDDIDCVAVDYDASGRVIGVELLGVGEPVIDRSGAS